MSDSDSEENTDIETMTEVSKKEFNQTRESYSDSIKSLCSTKPTEAILIEKNGLNFMNFKDFVGIKAGFSKSDGFSGKDAYLNYLRHNLTYEECSKQRETQFDGNYLPKLSGEGEKLKKMLEELFGENAPTTLLFNNLATFVNQNISEIDNMYEDILDFEIDNEKIFEELKNKSNSQGNDKAGLRTFKILICFTWNHFKVFESINKIVGGGTASSKLANFSTSISFEKKSKLKFILMHTVLLFGYIYFALLLLESYRLLLSSINRILDARAVYLESIAVTDGLAAATNVAYSQKFDNEYIDYMFSFFVVFYQIGAGSLIDTLDMYKGQALEDAKQILKSVANQASKTTVDRCAEGYISCFNGFLTGLTSQEVEDSSKIQLSYEVNAYYNDVTHSIQESFSKIKYDATFVASGLITSVNGLLACTITLLNQHYPEIYTSQHVLSSIGALQGNYLGRGNYLALTGIAGQLYILYDPKKALELPKKAADYFTQSSPGPEYSNEAEIDPNKLNEGENYGISVTGNNNTLTITKGGKKKSGKTQKFLEIFGRKRKTYKKKKLSKKKLRKNKTKKKKTIKKRKNRKV